MSRPYRLMLLVEQEQVVNDYIKKAHKMGLKQERTGNLYQKGGPGHPGPELREDAELQAEVYRRIHRLLAHPQGAGD